MSANPVQNIVALFSLPEVFEAAEVHCFHSSRFWRRSVVTAAAADVIGGGCPVVLFTSRTDTTFVERARTAGVMAYLLKPLRPAELAPALDLAVARFGEAQTLRLRLDERKVIERAKGALMRRYNLSEETAFQRLRRAAMDSRRSMADISRALLVSESVAGDVPAE